jgi:hypothetical protein
MKSCVLSVIIAVISLPSFALAQKGKGGSSKGSPRAATTVESQWLNLAGDGVPFVIIDGVGTEKSFTNVESFQAEDLGRTFEIQLGDCAPEATCDLPPGTNFVADAIQIRGLGGTWDGEVVDGTVIVGISPRLHFRVDGEHFELEGRFPTRFNNVAMAYDTDNDGAVDRYVMLTDPSNEYSLYRYEYFATTTTKGKKSTTTIEKNKIFIGTYTNMPMTITNDLIGGNREGFYSWGYLTYRAEELGFIE